MHDLLQLEKRHRPVWLVLDTAGVQAGQITVSYPQNHGIAHTVQHGIADTGTA
jgi:hypothetical protein